MKHDEATLEQLSALFDGELQGDEKAFLCRRIANDPELAAYVGRWHRLGDALRAAHNPMQPGAATELEPLSRTLPAMPPPSARRLWSGSRRKALWLSSAAAIAAVAVISTAMLSRQSPNFDRVAQLPQEAPPVSKSRAADSSNATRASEVAAEPALPEAELVAQIPPIWTLPENVSPMLAQATSSKPQRTTPLESRNASPVRSTDVGAQMATHRDVERVLRSGTVERLAVSFDVAPEASWPKSVIPGYSTGLNVSFDGLKGVIKAQDDVESPATEGDKVAP